ncbi:hypothetical protein [Hymenobacter rubripertinctus]|uniref:hypothetical protein n=1 Tax=Hymenobacter rubripertinctus TaxID=2029981 RepID=UPI0011C3754C|nr:hypothetical protein [Hymenobacter rubripertinctus]
MLLIAEPIGPQKAVGLKQPDTTVTFAPRLKLFLMVPSPNFKMKNILSLLTALIIFTACQVQKTEKLKVDRRYSFNPRILDTSKRANRNVLKSYFLCNCVKVNSESDDSSSALYFESLSNYSQYALDFFENYSHSYALKINETNKEFTFAECMRHYNSREFNKIVANLDSALHLNRQKSSWGKP